MPQKTNLNVPPYNDDFDKDKGFYKVLFRPGYSIQTRELTTLQSVLQNQIENFGRSRFKQGQQVVPGEVAFNNKLDYVKLASVSEVAVNVNGNIVFEKYDISKLVGKTLQGLSSGVQASVIWYSKSSEVESDVLFIKYTNSGNANNEFTFRQGETLEVLDLADTPTLVVGTDGSVLPTTITVKDYDTGISKIIDSPAMGYASAVKVESGVYFVNGYFVNNSEQLIVVDKYYNKPSAKVGFAITENIITPEKDSSLYDNARGSSNFAAPGSHRLNIDLNLVVLDFDSLTDSQYIQLVTIKNGEIQQLVKSTDYNVLEETLARRTFDESGDYVVDNFSLDLREYYQKDNNKGVYPLNEETGLVNGKKISDASELMLAGVESGKAYIKGYEIINKEKKYLEINKARDTLVQQNNRTKFSSLAYFNITNVYGSIPLNADGAELTAYPTIYLNSAFNDGSIGLNNTETSTYSKQTLNRRGQKFGLDDGIITLYLRDPANYASRSFPTDSEFGTTFTKLWYVVNLGSSAAATIAKSVDVLSYSVVKRPDIPYVGTTEPNYLELTVVGNKEDIQIFLKEYDDFDTIKRRKLFLTQDDAREFYFQSQGVNASISAYSEIIDYNDVVTPIIGAAKPKDFGLQKVGSGFNVDTDIILSKGRLNSGQTTYNSIFKLSYFNPTFFTKIVLDQSIATETFAPGKYITGLTSKAYGIVEGSAGTKYTSGSILYVRVLSGQFVSGETIADESGNTQRIARDGTISHFVVNYRGEGYPATTKLKINGITYDNSAVEIGITGNFIYKVIIKDKNLVSQTYSTTPTISFDTGNTNVISSAVISPVLYRNSVQTYGAENVKSMHSSFGAGDVYTFTCDVETFDSSFLNTKVLTDFTFSGSRGSKYIECNGFSGNPATELVPGDLLQFTDTANNVVRVIVQRIDLPEGLIKSRIYFDNVLQNNVANTSVIRVRPNVGNAAKSTLLIPTSAKYLSKIVQDPENSEISYFFRRDFVTIASTSGGNITFAAQLPYGTQRFAPFSKENFVLTVLDKKSSTTVSNGDIIFLKDSQVTIENSLISETGGVTAGSVIINLPSSFFGTTSNFPVLKLTATVEVLKARPRLKTFYDNKRVLIITPGDKVIPLRGIDIDSSSDEVMSYSDVIKIRYIYEGTSQTPPVVSSTGELVTGTDVTDKFTFDDGQRDTFYDVSRLVLKPGYETPTGQLIVAFDYFEHSQGDFCTVDSYVHESGVSISDIPNFNSAVLGKISLRDVFDFRPKVDSTAIISGYQDTSILSVTDFNSFTKSSGVVSNCPASDSNLSYTISYSASQFLDRIDGIFLDKRGSFIVKEGNSSLNPTKPADVDDAIPLYYFYIPAYTAKAEDVKIIAVDNKRYTMRDIAKLEKRVERLENYTLLSVLEQQALNMQIKDEVGLDRFKSGFVVDNFENHGVGNVKSFDYRCSIDTQQSSVRPLSNETSLRLSEVSVNDDQRSLNNYRKTNQIITLPYTDLVFAKNPFATKKLSVNPFVVLQYVGDARLTPNLDKWFDQKQKPLVLDNDSKVFTAFYAKSDSREAYASLHNNFIVNWIGTNRVFYNTSSLSNVSSTIATTSTTNASTSSVSNISPQNNQLAQNVPSKSVGSNTVSSVLQQFCRSVPVFFTLTRMKPFTKLYSFMDKQSIDRWVIQDFRYTGVPGNSLSTFNSGIVTDANGNASGMILIPSGYAPQTGSAWTGNIQDVQYDETISVFFTTGIKNIKFTSNQEGLIDSSVDSYTEINYYVTGSLPEQPSSIISTTPAVLKAQEGIQYVESTRAQVKPNPLSQSFKIEKFPGGLFLTGVDLFFNTKSSTIPIKVYLTNIESGKPGKYIVPGSESVLNPDTYIRVYTNGTLNVTQGENCTGVTSGAVGPIKEIYDRNNIVLIPSTTGSYTLTNDQVYTIVLSNHNGKSFVANEELRFPSLTTYNAAQNTNLRATIARNSGRLTELKVSNLGSGYDSATITVESPQLPGGVQARAVCSVSSGNIFAADILVSGSGYTDPPSIIINGSGTSASAASIQSYIEIDTPAVRMGVATDPTSGTVLNSTTPTKFTFEYPVYLQNETEYALVIESDSTDYSLWASKLGEVEIASNSVVTATPLLGSVFKSQNVDTWTEDLLEDIKFTLYRAEFDISRDGIVELSNKTLGYEMLDANPFETDSLSDTTATSSLYKNNNKIIKVNHRINGFEDTGKSYVSFKNSNSFGGFDSSQINNVLYQVTNTGTNSYNIVASTLASSNAFGGGSKVLASYNKKYEKLFAQLEFLNFAETKINAEVKTTNILPIDVDVINYQSYSQSDYEKTFLNEEHFFNNQKVVCSRINELKNLTTSSKNSLQYKLSLSSTKSYLSPVVDLRSANVILVNNEVEKCEGKEDRYGRRDQLLQFYPVYKFTVNGTNVNNINAGDAANVKLISGNTSQAQAAIVKFDSTTAELYVKMLTDTLFTPSESLTFASQPSLTGLTIASSGLTDVTFNIQANSTVTSVDKTDTTKSYDNLINGKVISWDSKKKVLRVACNKQPINDNYISASSVGSDYARISIASNTGSQGKDIFRVGDLVGYENQSTDTKSFLEVKSVSYADGVLFVPETNNNSSSLAKYLTKEITLETAATSIDVRLTANIFEVDDVQVLYRVNYATSQYNFDDLSWELFNGTGKPDVEVIPSTDNLIAGYIENQKAYKEYKYSVNNLQEFTSFAVKIVMRSSNPVFVPKIQDIRVVASF